MSRVRSADFRSPALRSSGMVALLLVLLGAGLFLPRLGSVPFLGKDEPKNAEALREMMVRGDWVTTTLREEPWFDKPILYYWVSLLFFHLLGPGETAARLAPALFGIGGVLLTWGFARECFDGKTAARAGIILATSLEYFWFSRTAVVDLPLVFCVSLSTAAFFFAIEERGPRSLWYPIAFGSMGAAALAKGPVGIVLPVLVAGAHLVLTGSMGELRRIPWVVSILCFLGAGAPWYVVVSLRHGRRFWDDFILNRNIERYLSTVHHHPGPIYYYLPVLILGMFPWGGLVPLAVAKAILAGGRTLFRERRSIGYLILWLFVPLLFFSFAGSKLPSYMLPAFPALAILVSLAWEPILEAKDASPRWRAAGVVCLLLAFPALAAGIFAWCRSEAPDQLRAQVPLAGSLALTTLTLAFCVLGRRYRWIFPVCAGGGILALGSLVVFSLGNVREEASLTRISAAGVQLAREGSTVVAYRNFHNYLFFYTENLVPWVKERAELDRILAEKKEVYCYLESRGLKELQADPTLRLQVLDRQYTVSLVRIHRQGEGGSG